MRKRIKRTLLMTLLFAKKEEQHEVLRLLRRGKERPKGATSGD